MKLHTRVGVTCVLRVANREDDPLIQCQKQLFNAKRFAVVINHFQYLDVLALAHDRILSTIRENRHHPLFIGCAELIVSGEKVKEKEISARKRWILQTFLRRNESAAYELSENNQIKQKEVILRKKSSKKKVKGVGNLRIMM